MSGIPQQRWLKDSRTTADVLQTAQRFVLFFFSNRPIFFSFRLQVQIQIVVATGLKWDECRPLFPGALFGIFCGVQRSEETFIPFSSRYGQAPLSVYLSIWKIRKHILPIQ